MSRLPPLRVAWTAAAGGSATVTTIQLPIVAARQYRIVGWTAKRTAGTAVLWTPRIAEDSSWTNGDILTERVTYDGTDNPANPINDTFADEIYITSDANGRIYLKLCWGSGADNQATGEIWLEKAF